MNIFTTIIELGRRPFNTLPVTARALKLGEEHGEFCEALLHKLGYLPHKTMKEPLMGEGADVILCVLDALAGAYPELSPEELSRSLVEQMELKGEKWDRVMRVRYDDVNQTN